MPEFLAYAAVLILLITALLSIRALAAFVHEAHGVSLDSIRRVQADVEAVFEQLDDISHRIEGMESE